MADVRGSLPSGTIGPIVNDNFGDVAVATIALTAEGFTMEEMSSVTRDVRVKLRPVPRVRRIDLHGLRPQRVHMAASVAKIGRAHLCTPVTNAHLVCRLLLENKTTQQNNTT